MPRLLFEKTGKAIWISHLDLMRLFQRAFKRAGLPLTHTQGFNPRPSVSIALPLSVGVESHCELLDFDLDGDEIPVEEIQNRLNDALVEGVRVRQTYCNGRKIKELSLLCCELVLEYDQGVSGETERRICDLFSQSELIVPKKSKNGIVDQDIIPMIRRIRVDPISDQEIKLTAVICCQNPTLNPMQLHAAIERYLPDCVPDFVICRRIEIYDEKETIFR